MNRFTMTLEDKKDVYMYAQNGVDEILVYLKGYSFSGLRQFELDEIRDLVQKADSCNLRVSVSMNRLFFPDELDQSKEMLEKVCEAGASSVQCGDMALFRHAEKTGIAEKLVYQPAMLVTNRFDAAGWMDTGIGGIVISPLLTAEEIQNIAHVVRQTRLLIHGHMLMSISGRKLVGAYEKETGIKNLQRQGLSLREEKRDGLMPVYEDDRGTYIYSDYVLHSFLHMEELKEVQTFEISTLRLDPEEAVFALQEYRGRLYAIK